MASAARVVPDPVRRQVRVRGQVQGVGYRPFVYRLATGLGLAGWVRNDAEGVEIEVEGERGRIDAFVARLRQEAPPLARVDRVEARVCPPQEATAFLIDASRGGRAATGITPDAAVCPACLAELFDPADRRHRYPFINCTHCGPRYTLTRALPYDRPQTSMARFAMCPTCQEEYDDPENRRFHAQPNACFDCGPRLDLLDGSGAPVAGDPVAQTVARLGRGGIVAIKGLGGFHLACDARNGEAVARLRSRKDREEKPFAVMVAGAASAREFAAATEDDEALLHSRERPVVLLRKSAECDARLPGVAPGLAWLGVMLPYTPLHYLLFHEAAGRPAGTAWIREPQPLALVMTSANPGGEPLVTGNAEALTRLAGIADGFLVHDRDIVVRCDDSVVRAALSPSPSPRGGGEQNRRVAGNVGGGPSPSPRGGGEQNPLSGYGTRGPSLAGRGGKTRRAALPSPSGRGVGEREGVYSPLPLGEGSGEGEKHSPPTRGEGPGAGGKHSPPPRGEGTGERVQFIRRARGYTPRAIRLAAPGPSVLACGGLLKNTVCATRGDEAFLSQHIGDLDNRATCVAQEQTVQHLLQVLQIEPQAVACDLHLDFFSTRFAAHMATERGVPLIQVQHHHAHIAAVAAEHGVRSPLLGLALDGVGLGPGGGIWGGELLRVEGGRFERIGRLKELRLPGGDRAAREPWRMAAAALYALDRSGEIAARFPGPSGLAIRTMLDGAIHAPRTSSAGRLFDAAAGLLGVKPVASFEGQAAMLLEGLAERHGPVPPLENGFALDPDGGELSLLPLLARLADGVDREYGAALFHATFAEALAQWAIGAVARTGLHCVALGGGCFLNRVLTRALRPRLEGAGIRVLEASQVPPNDGGLSLGQAWVAMNTRES